MKTKYSLFGILAIITLVMSFILPGNMVTPAPAAADAGICKWLFLDMPGSVAGKGDLLISNATNAYTHSEVEKIITTANPDVLLVASKEGIAGGPIKLRALGSKGVTFSSLAWTHLSAAMTLEGIGSMALGASLQDVWNIAAAPDDPLFWAVVTGDNQTAWVDVDGPVNVWVTANGGASWQNTKLSNVVAADNAGAPLAIGAIDISPNYGGKRDIAVGVRTGDGTNALKIYLLQTGGFTGWKPQTIANLNANAAPITTADVVALKFSPTYVGDASIAVVLALPALATADDGTFFNIALRDLSTSANNIVGWAFPKSIEVKNSTATLGASPDATTIILADLELPSDFSGQSASLRRAYISLDAGGVATPDNSGIYRIDDTTVYELLDTTGQTATGKRITSIAYFGTYASGKLLAGEFNGQSCTATVPTWFTDSPTVCPVPCWYPALKPTTGAGICNCGVGIVAPGHAWVTWSNDGSLAYVATSSLAEAPKIGWFQNLDHPALNMYDETAVGISRNNGETWNQIGLIDTHIDFFNDVAVTADCQTIFLASANTQNCTDNELGPEFCSMFDSVWRATKNGKVAAPFTTMLPLGFFWERVFTHVTAVSCNQSQSDLPLLRLPPPGANCDNGMIVGWAAQNTRAMAWSPDWGDYWANINPRNPVQDFAFMSPTLLYTVSATAQLQKMPYTGTAWSSVEGDVDTLVGAAHMIWAWPFGDKQVVAIGAASSANAVAYPASMSLNGGTSFAPVPDQSPTGGSMHVAFDPAFDTNSTWYLGDDAANIGTVYRVTYPGVGISLPDSDMMAASNGAIGTMAPEPVGIFGLQTAWTGGALYAAHFPYESHANGHDPNSDVERTLWPLAGMPKPGIYWDSMKVYPPTNYESGVTFTREPWSLKICGCCTLDTNSKLWALDARPYIPYAHPAEAALGLLAEKLQGFLWGFEDCLAKKGPALITADGVLIGCDPVSGRAQEVNLCWEQLCVANGYDIEIAKTKDFSIRVIDWVIAGLPTWDPNNDEFGMWNARFLKPVDLLIPCVFFPAGGEAPGLAGGSSLPGNNSAIAWAGNLECGHTYFWRIQVRSCATQELLRSQWSVIRSFTVKAGLPVRADYYGLKLLAPDNGCLGCPVKPAAFSWTPFKETTKYKFVLAKDAAMTQVVAEAEVPTTAYQYAGTLDYSSNYFWRVMTLTPAPSDWSATFSFQTEPKPAPPAAPAAAPTTPMWVWVIIAIGAILIIITLVLIFKTRRV